MFTSGRYGDLPDIERKISSASVNFSICQRLLISDHTRDLEFPTQRKQRGQMARYWLRSLLSRYVLDVRSIMLISTEREKKSLDGFTGSVSIELTLVFPVLVIMLVGVGSIGRIVNQLSWMSQVAYQTALAAGEADATERATVLEARWQRILEGYEAVYGGSRPVNNEAHNVSISNLPSERSVRVEISGDVTSLFSGIGLLPLGTSVTGPIMSPDAAVAGSLATPENPITLYDCTGAQGAGDAQPCLDNCNSMDSCYCEDGMGGTYYSFPCAT